MVWAIGIASFLLWGVLWLLDARWRELPVYERPRLTHWPGYALWAGTLRKAVLVISLVALAAAHRAALTVGLLILLGGWMIRRMLSSAGSRRRSMQREFDRLRRENPGSPEVDILYQVIYARHARWGAELVQQIVQENPTLEEAARVVGRLENTLKR